MQENHATALLEVISSAVCRPPITASVICTDIAQAYAWACTMSATPTNGEGVMNLCCFHINQPFKNSFAAVIIR